MSVIEEYREALHNPQRWVTRSVGLFQSAEAIWHCPKPSMFDSNRPKPSSPLEWVNEFGYYKVAMMLYGMAVETAIKAILIRDKSPNVVVTIETDGGGSIRKVTLKNTGDSGGGHDLVSLAKNAGLISKNDTADVDAKRHLESLSEYIVWRGRYPVAKGVAAEDEKKQLANNAATIEFVQGFLREHLAWAL